MVGQNLEDRLEVSDANTLPQKHLQNAMDHPEAVNRRDKLVQQCRSPSANAAKKAGDLLTGKNFRSARLHDLLQVLDNQLGGGAY